MSKSERHRVAKAVSADADAARAVDRLLQRLVIIVEEEGPEEVLAVLLQYVSAPDPEEGA
jgi:hypothetical protein